mmetsp:Transcript_103160/g.295980  ORF Transcript_103160/g.295980 Transcript_103160/m.295980 type:complete len:237 (-) Transcript_103160:325-1035(-)
MSGTIQPNPQYWPACRLKVSSIVYGACPDGIASTGKTSRVLPSNRMLVRPSTSSQNPSLKPLAGVAGVRDGRDLRPVERSSWLNRSHSTKPGSVAGVSEVPARDVTLLMGAPDKPIIAAREAWYSASETKPASFASLSSCSFCTSFLLSSSPPPLPLTPVFSPPPPPPLVLLVLVAAITWYAGGMVAITASDSSSSVVAKGTDSASPAFFDCRSILRAPASSPPDSNRAARTSIFE